MDPEVFALENVTSAVELKAAVDALPREEKYYTEQVLGILRLKQHLTDSPAADSISSFLNALSEPEGTIPLLRTSEMRDFIINVVAPNVGPPETVENIGRIIRNINQNKPASELYSTPDSFKAILSCFHSATTTESAYWIVRGLNAILDCNPSVNKILNDLPVLEAFSALLPHATSDDAVWRASEALQKTLHKNDEAQKIFGTPPFSKKINSIEQYATSDDGKTAFKSVVDILQPIVDRRLPFETSLSDAATSQELSAALSTAIKQSDCWSSLVEILVSKQHLIQDEDSTTSTANFLSWCYDKNDKVMQQQAKEVFELIQNTLLPSSLNVVTTILHVHDSLAMVVKHSKEAQQFFSTASFNDYVISSLPHSGESVLQILNSLLIDNKSAQETFGKPDFKEKLDAKFSGNNSRDFVSVMDILNKSIIRVRFEALVKLVAEQKEDIAETELKKLAECQIDTWELIFVDGATLLSLQFSPKQIVVFGRLVQKIKGNGAPTHQDPFTLLSLDKLRQEHDDLRKKHQGLVASSSKSLDDRAKALDDAIKQLKSSQQEVGTLQSHLDAISPFVSDKFYQIESNVNHLPQPQPGAAVSRHVAASSTRIFGEAEKLMKKSGALIYNATSPNQFQLSPVKGFTLQSIDVILRGTASFEERMDRLQGLRVDLTDKFNPAFNAFSPEQQQVLKVLFEHFLPRPPNANKKFPNLVNVFHGTKIDCLDSAIKGLVAMRSSDEGFFGYGVYTTTSIEYAAKYARGDFDPAGQSPARADGCYPVLWCVAAVGVCHPVSRADDYSKGRSDKTCGVVSDFFGSPLAKNCDCHCALVGESLSYQAVPPQNMEYLEMVVDQENQVIPIAVLWVKPT